MRTPTPEEERRSRIVEKTLARFNQRFLMNDFVFPSPQFQSGNQKKELCDLLLVFGPSCILVSIKSTDEPLPAGEEIQSWLEKREKKSRDQLRGALRTLGRMQIDAVNGWGESLSFRTGDLKPFCVISALDDHGRVGVPLKLSASDWDGAVPLHTLSLGDLLGIVNHTGSANDFFGYFERRKVVAAQVPGINMEGVFLKATYEDVQDFASLVPFDALSSNSDFMAFVRENGALLSERLGKADIINDMIYEAFRVATDVDEIMSGMPAAATERAPGDREIRRQAALYLNMMTTAEKTAIGARILAACEKDLSAEHYSISHKVMWTWPFVVFVLCDASHTRRERATILLEVTLMKMHQRREQYALGVAMSQRRDCYEFVILDVDEFVPEVDGLLPEAIRDHPHTVTDKFGRNLGTFERDEADP